MAAVKHLLSHGHRLSNPPPPLYLVSLFRRRFSSVSQPSPPPEPNANFQNPVAPKPRAPPPEETHQECPPEKQSDHSEARDYAKSESRSLAQDEMRCNNIGNPVVSSVHSSERELPNPEAENKKRKTMSSSYDDKKCGLCSASLATGRKQAMFTSECSHSFHFSCLSNYGSHGIRFCPVCYTQWKQPLTFPSEYNPAFQYPTPVHRVHRRPQFPSPLYEPLEFCDDEPISDEEAEKDSLDSLRVGIRAIPERPSVAASQSASLFAVLVGLKAPSLSDNGRSSQRAPVDIVTVLDVSGSMSGRKLALVKRAVDFVIDNLGVSDRLSVVCFSNSATRMLPLRRMTGIGREYAKRAVDSLVADGGTNIVDGLEKGARVLDERRYKNPVSSIIFLSDGNDTYNRNSFASHRFEKSGFLHLLPPSISPRNQGLETDVFPVHSFGFGSDHDPVTMHGISDASGGTFSFIESIEMVQDAFASCIGGLLSVVIQDLRLRLRSASLGVEIKSIPSERCRSTISNQRSEGVINVGDLYADEEKEFLINLSIPAYLNNIDNRKTSLLDITCSYRDAVSKQTVVIEGEQVEIRRPEIPSSEDMAVNLEVDRQRSRLHAAEIIQKAQEMAEAGNLTGARNILAKKRKDLMGSASSQAGDVMIKWLEVEMEETEIRMGSENMYMQSGRAYALAGMSSHAAQRATTGGSMLGAAGGYGTPQMANMVNKSRRQKIAGEGNTTSMEEL